MSRTRNTADLVSLNAIHATSGRVGIGTTARSNQFYVDGNTQIVGVVTASGFVGDLTGNADTATQLETARNIGGVSFDGTADINLPGVNTTGNQDTSGNAGTATSLATARTIGGVSFDGTSNINLPGVNATGNQDTTGNAGTATSLATARTIAGVSFDGSQNISLNNNAITNGAGYITTSFTNTNQLTNGAGFITASDDITGNAATATQLETARNIGGVSFDGTADINLPGVNAAGNQNTSGTAAGLSGAPSIIVTDITAVGNVSIAGTLTYEDVKSVDSLGIVTARTGVRVTTGGLIVSAGGASITGVTTSSGGFVGDVTGNADTATRLATARLLGGVTFDGTGNINLPGVNTTGNQDTTGNAGTATSLATARTIAGVSFDGTANISLNNNAITNGAGYITTSFTNTNQLTNGAGFITASDDITGNAGTATSLATARTIAGVSFDGTSNISLNNNAITNGAGYITTSFTNTNQLTNGAGFITASDDITGNAGTATSLATARTIAGVSFDGTSNISLNNNAITNGAGYITTSFTNTSQLTNDAGFITNNVTGDFTLTDTDTGSAAGPELTLYRNSASPAPGDYLGQIMFKGENSNGGEENYAKITGKISDETLGTEDGLIETAIKGDGSFTIVSRQRSDELQLINGVGLSVDGDTTLGTTSATSLTASTAFYMPQYTTTARDAGSFNEGAMIYNTTTKKMEFYDGTNWNTLPGMTIGLTVALDS